jgi:hypothetical protein
MSWYRAPLWDLWPDITSCRNVEVQVTLRLSVSMSWYQAPLWDLRPDTTSCRNVEVTLRLTVSQYVLVSSTLVGLVTRYYFVAMSKLLYDCQSVSQSVSMSWYRAPLWDLWPDITSSECRSYFMTVSQSVSMSWYRAPLWDLRPDITSCQNVELKVTLRLTVAQSVSMSWHRAPLWDLWPDIEKIAKNISKKRHWETKDRKLLTQWN